MEIDFRRFSISILIVLLFGLLPVCSDSLAGSASLKSQMVKMRDGVHLSTDVYFEGEVRKGRPSILIRTVYNKNYVFRWNPVWEKLVSQGYAIVIQDIRGRYESEGSYQIARGRREDGWDTLEWILNQPWANGKVGLGGCSYQGETQIVLEATKHPSLVVGQPQSAASGYYRPGRAWQSFSGGAFELGQTAGWFAGEGTNVFYGPNLTGESRSDWFNDKRSHNYKMRPDFDFNKYLKNIKTLPTISLLSRSGATPNDFDLWRANTPDGDYFRSMDLVDANDRISVPNLFFDTWYDYGSRETLMMAEQFRQNARTDLVKHNQFVVIGPGTHCNFPQRESEKSVGNRPLDNVAYDYESLQLNWFNKWLKGEDNNINQRPFLTYYVMGEHKWRYSDSWPLKNTKYTKWYLDHSVQANSLSSDGTLTIAKPLKEKNDSFVYDPEDPVPSLGGHTCCAGTDTEAGGYDQTEIERRGDVLVYSSPVLKKGIEVTGLIKANLFVTSSAKDTDFTVKLVDVYPDGRAFNVQEGVIRMRYRESLRSPSLINPGQIYEVEVDLNATSNFFTEGHKIRVEVSSSSFPRIERNLNTGEENYKGTHFISATNSILLGGKHASYIELPVIERVDRE
jgi:putative CocE/NonD family hydrolase